MKKIISITLAVGIMISLLSSCFGGGEDVAILYYTYSDTYISGVRGEMDTALREAGLGFHNYDAGSMQTTQTEQVDTAITKGATLLAVNIVDTGSSDAARAIVGKARNAGIPLIFFNRSVDDEVLASYDKCVFVGTDFEAAGIMQGEMIGKYLVENYDKVDINGDGVISYVMFKGQQGNLEAEARTRLAVERCNEILAEAGRSQIRFYDVKNTQGYLVDQNGNWSNAAANDYMKTILSAYSESGGNMVELVIANNDEMALGALAALEEVGYNRSGARHIPVFGVDATDAARAKIAAGAMTGTVKQDGAAMARAIAAVAENMLAGRGAFEGISGVEVVGDRRINIPYSTYTVEESKK